MPQWRSNGQIEGNPLNSPFSMGSFDTPSSDLCPGSPGSKNQVSSFLIVGQNLQASLLICFQLLSPL